jgi:hypothetical protein
VSALLRAALDYAGRGWPVHPVQGKNRPLTRHGVKDASTDPDIIRGWWQRWPDANIAIACGSPGPHVLDIDDPTAAQALLDRLRDVDAPTVASGRGQHQYFAGEDRATIALDFGELRGRGSYIIAPPSIHPTGREYVWLHAPNGKLPPVPGFIARNSQTAGRGEAPTREQVPPTQMYAYLLDRATRLARAGEADPDVIEAALVAAFETKRIPDRSYGDVAAGRRDTRRLAEWAVNSEIAGRERARASAGDGWVPGAPPPRGARGGTPPETPVNTGDLGVPTKTPLAPPSGALRVLDIEQMIATPPPPVPWTVKPILVTGCTTMLAGREGRGKSMLALAVAAAIGHGNDIATMPTTAPGRVLYIDAENGEREAHRRVHGLNVKPGTLIYVEANGFNLKTHVHEIEALVDEHNPDLLILDSLRSLAPGFDENDSLQAEAVLRPIILLTQSRRMATCVLHHASRASGEYRGSTAIGAAVELGFTLGCHDDDPDETRRKLACWKIRPAAKPPPLWFSIEPQLNGGILISEAEPFEPRASARESAEAALLGSLNGQPTTWATWAKAAGLDPKHGTARRARDRLVERSRVKQDEQGNWEAIA